MHSIKSLQKKIEEGLEQLTFNSSPIELYEPIRYMLTLGGKRMRPLLVMMGCDMFNGDVDKALSASLGIELFHNFTLLHDDIMDKAPLRRSQQTVHEKWNINVAILSGDAMFVKAHQLMMMTEDSVLRKVLDIFSSTAIEVCEGQQLDMNFEQQSICIADYINMISHKTAVLLGASLQIGALIAGASAIDSQHLYNFGKNIGIAFQLQDDLLDVYGNTQKFGKQVGGDIIANKKTFLFLKASEVLDDKSKKILADLYSCKTNLSSEAKVKEVTLLFDKAHIKNLAKDEMQHFHSNALQHFSDIHLPAENKKGLLDFCETLMVRQI